MGWDELEPGDEVGCAYEGRSGVDIGSVRIGSVERVSKAGRIRVRFDDYAQTHRPDGRMVGGPEYRLMPADEARQWIERRAAINALSQASRRVSIRISEATRIGGAEACRALAQALLAALGES